MKSLNKEHYPLFHYLLPPALATTILFSLIAATQGYDYQCEGYLTKNTKRATCHIGHTYEIDYANGDKSEYQCVPSNVCRFIK